MRRLLTLFIFVLILVLPVNAQSEDSLTVRLGITDKTKVAFTTKPYNEVTAEGPDRAGSVPMVNYGDSTTSMAATVYASGHSNKPERLQLTVYGTALTRYTEIADSMSFTDDVVSTTYSYGNGSSTTVSTAATSATTPDANGTPQGALVATFKETVDPTALRTLGENAITVTADISQALQGEYAAVLTLVCAPAEA